MNDAIASNIPHKSQICIEIESHLARRRPINSAKSIKPAFHNIDFLKASEQAEVKLDLQAEIRVLVAEVVGKAKPIKPAKLKRKPVGGDFSLPMIEVEGMLSIFDAKDFKSRRSSTKPISKDSKLKVKKSQYLSKSIRLPSRPLYSLPEPKRHTLKTARDQSDNTKKSGASSISISTNASTVKRALQAKTLGTVISNCEAAESSHHESDKYFMRKIYSQRARSQEILNSIDDIKDCLKEIDGPCLLEDRLMTKKYNRMVDRGLKRKVGLLKEDCKVMSEYIASLGRTKIWKFSSPSFPKKTDKLMNSLPEKRY